MLSSLLPKGAPFFELLLEQNGFLCSAASLTAEILEGQSGFDKPHQEITRLEEEADSLHMDIVRHLSQTFITPIDREDILHISKEQEEAIDRFHILANRLYISEFPTMRFPMRQLARTVKGMVELTGPMLEGLAHRRDCKEGKAFRMLSEESAMLLSTGLGELHDIPDPTPEKLLGVLKWSQSYDRMELAIRQVVRLFETLEEAVLKNA